MEADFCHTRNPAHHKDITIIRTLFQYHSLHVDHPTWLKVSKSWCAFSLESLALHSGANASYNLNRTILWKSVQQKSINGAKEAITCIVSKQQRRQLPGWRGLRYMWQSTVSCFQVSAQHPEQHKNYESLHITSLLRGVKFLYPLSWRYYHAVHCHDHIPKQQSIIKWESLVQWVHPNCYNYWENQPNC